MTFAYQPRPIEPTSLVEGDQVYRPLVPIHVVTLRGVAFIWALADTGADTTLLPASLADEIGVPLSLHNDDATIVEGFGGQSLTVMPGDVNFTLSDGHQRFRWEAQVGFVQFQNPHDEVAVLGHSGFFEFFAATFDSSARQLSLVPTTIFPGTVKADFRNP